MCFLLVVKIISLKATPQSPESCSSSLKVFLNEVNVFWVKISIKFEEITCTGHLQNVYLPFCRRDSCTNCSSGLTEITLNNFRNRIDKKYVGGFNIGIDELSKISSVNACKPFWIFPLLSVFVQDHQQKNFFGENVAFAIKDTGRGTSFLWLCLEQVWLFI